MREDLQKRVVLEAEYIVEYGATVRAAAKIFHVGKSTIHKDMTDRLMYVNKSLYEKVQKVLKINLLERHIRGGEATKRKYIQLKNA